MRIEVQSLLNGFEAPAVFYRENTVRYYNEAAKTLFPQLKEGGPLPEDFDAADSPFRAEANRTEKGILYLFRPKYEERAAGDMEAIGRQLREATGNLMILRERLSTEVGSGPEGESLLGAMDRNLYLLRRLCDHADLLRQLEGRRVGVYREGPVDLCDAVAEVAVQAESLCRQVGIVFCDENTVPITVVRGDKELLSRMLLNLLSNAMKAAGPGGRVGLRAEKRENRVLLTVWDNGTGMEPARMAAIFRPQRHHGLPRPEEGAGMGLRLVREIAVLHGGTVLAESRQEGGTRVMVSLPIRPACVDGFHAPAVWGVSVESLALTELADVLPACVYQMEE